MLKGTICPSITPMTSEGTIDYDAWGDHLDCLIDAGIHGILIFGSIGEFYAIPAEEKKTAIAWACDHVAGRTALLVGTGGNDVREVIDLTNFAHDKGATASVIVSPFYFGPSPDLAIEYFNKVAGSTKSPIILYNFPDRTGSDLSAPIVDKLAKANPNIIGVKDTIDSIAHNRSLISAVGSDLSIFSGFDEYYISNRIAGGAGIISGLTNIIPEIFVAMHESYESGAFAEAISFASRISAFMGLYSIGDNFIHTIKTAVRLRTGADMFTGTREPYLSLSSAEVDQLRELIREATA
ncbi:MAG: dihydrodipicolinate synthase family protein [Corynebacterium glucuronolyticum]|nr:dihydrodipicolinate synthase family protein [Mycobacteriaceae bacterium]MDY5833649.1 dihydrodipicolinate synthase family protein [Corynebacterium glucuronolyticum]